MVNFISEINFNILKLKFKLEYFILIVLLLITMSENKKIQQLEEENRALRDIINQCRSVLSNLHYEWVNIGERVGVKTMRYYCDCESQSQSESSEDVITFKRQVLNWFDETNEFMDYLKKDCCELDSNCQVKSLEHIVSISAWVCWNNKTICFHYCGDDSFSDFGMIELNGKKFVKLCPEYYAEMKSVMDYINVAHNNDVNLIYGFHVLLAELALFNNQSEYNITTGDCYTFTHQFKPLGYLC